MGTVTYNRQFYMIT